MRFIARLFAFILTVLFIFLLPLSLLSFNIGRVVFNRPLLKGVMAEAVVESQLIPSTLAWFSEEVSAGLPLAEAAQDDLSAVLVSLTEQGWQAIREEVISDDILVGWVSTSVDGFYDWLDSNELFPTIVLDMKTFKTRIDSDFGFRALEIAYNALPLCEDERVDEFKAMLEAAIPGSNVYYPPCQFPQEFREDQLTDYLDSPLEVVNVIPDTFEVMGGENSPQVQNQSVETWTQLKSSLRLFRTFYWTGLVVSFLLLIMIAFLAVRSFRSFARWEGIPLALAGIGGVMLSWAPNVFVTGFLISGPLQDTSPPLQDEILQVVSHLSEEIFSPMMIQALVILITGGLILVFVGGMMGRQQTTKKTREETAPLPPKEG